MAYVFSDYSGTVKCKISQYNHNTELMIHTLAYSEKTMKILLKIQQFFAILSRCKILPFQFGKAHE